MKNKGVNMIIWQKDFSGGFNFPKIMIICCEGVQYIAIEEQLRPFTGCIQFSPQPVWYREVKTHPIVGRVGGIGEIGGLKGSSQLGKS